MKRLALGALALLCAISVSAQNTRTFVSGTGSDASSTCAVTAPCRTIPYAFSVTNAGGDIVVLDSAGYGPSLTINKSINIVVPPGIFATMTPSSFGATAIAIAAGPSDTVRIDGLQLLGTGASNSQIGVSIGTCLRTELSHMKIKEVAYPVKVVADVRVELDQMNISNFVYGIWSSGVSTNPATSTLKVFLYNSSIKGGQIGVKIDNGTFMIPSSNSGLIGSRIEFCSTASYTIAASVSDCTSGPQAIFFSAGPTDARSTTNTNTPCTTP